MSGFTTVHNERQIALAAENGLQMRYGEAWEKIGFRDKIHSKL